jgi:exodeoxyribonuclease VII large subunit
MFRPKRRLLAFRPDSAQQVRVRARFGLCEPRGDYQLIVEHMEPSGEGIRPLMQQQHSTSLGSPVRPCV